MSRREKHVLAAAERFERVSVPTNIILIVFFALVAFLCLMPFLFIIAISISSEGSIARHGYQFIPSELSSSAYEYLWKNRNMIFDATKVSLIVTLGGTVLGLFLTSSMGYVISRPNYKLKGFFTWVVFIPMIFNGGLISTYNINTTVFGLKDTYWALIFPLLMSGFNVIICKTFFRTTVPDSLIESAEIDGASQWRIYFRIVLPISLPVLATIALFLVFGYWNDWWQAMLYIDRPDLKPLQALLSAIDRNLEYFARNAATLGMSRMDLIREMPRQSFRMGIAVVIITPIALAYPFFQRYFISGLTIGAVKG
ncbi:MAG: carbohydrate ABC transporter permease [Oscillospiraceae bacterium]|nr:carbohydrate ABC transporter permease [Oscillospiraceae bacterium]